jgi:subfamily B ATP-binding cassette protein MsbA
VRTHGAEAYEKQRFERVSEENRRQSMKEALTKAITSPIILMLVAFSMAVLVWLAMAPALLNSMTPG